jgi:UDP-glucose 4-epimerase
LFLSARAGSGRDAFINDLAEKVLCLSESDCAVVHQPPREGDILHSVADISKAREAFGYGPRLVLEEGLRGLLLYRRGAAS